MNLRSSRRVATQPTATGLHPMLRSSLAGLDVQLEAEMARYRRHKAGYPAPAPKGFMGKENRKPVDLINPGVRPAQAGQASHYPEALPNGAKGTAEPVLPVSPGSPNPQPWDHQVPAAATTGLAAAAFGSLAAPEVATAAEAPSISEALPTDPLPIPSAIAPSTVSTDAENSDPFAISESDLVLFDSLRLSDEFVEAETSGSRALATPSAADQNPYDYLESSEELLRSLSEAEPDFVEEPSFITHLFTPMGVGSLVLLLLCSATLGYVIINPASLQHLGFDRFFKPRPTESTTNSPSAPSPGGAVSSPAANGLPNSPDLAAQEFVDLNLNTLSTLRTNPSSTLPVSPSAAPKVSPGMAVGFGATPATPRGPGGVSAVNSSPQNPLQRQTVDPAVVLAPSVTPSVAPSTALAVAPSVVSPNTVPVARTAPHRAPQLPPRVGQPSQAVNPPLVVFGSPPPITQPPALASSVAAVTSPAIQSAPPTVDLSVPQRLPLGSPSRPAVVQSEPSVLPPSIGLPPRETAAANPPAGVQGEPSAPPPLIGLPPRETTVANPPARVSAPAIPAASGRSYVVSAPYTGDRALESAQQVVPDAFLSSNGSRIQLGSFNDPVQAQQRARQLQQRGISAEVNSR